MPFRSGSLSVRRYRITDEVSESFVRTATMALRRYSYKPINAERGEKESFGWVDPRRPLEADLVWEDMVDGNLAFLAVRRDRKSFNKTLFRARREELFTAVKKEKGLERLTRQHRLALEEQLTIEMLKEVTPSVSFVEIVWDLNTHEVMLGSTSKSMCERIADLFASTFDLRLGPLFPALQGYAYMAEQGLEENFDRATAAAAEGAAS